MTNNSGEKRLEFLEKIYQEDRERWQKNEEQWRKNEERWQKNEERWQKNEERWQKNDQRFDLMMEVLKDIAEDLRKQRERSDSFFKIILRKLEK